MTHSTEIFELHMMIRLLWLLLASPFLVLLNTALSQKVKKQPGKEPIPVVIKNGVLQWSQDSKEVALFGVNYTAPFAYAYRAIAKTGISHEEAIRQDVYHFARLGLDAFRVHVWDTEISDTAGNLLKNEHLRLFDFLLAELKKYKIKTIVTPIAFWGNGYPERDENTPGFSRYYGKGKSTVNDTAIRAQENYLKQFFKHVNPYTGLSYQQDPDIIATEINNEPNHNGPQKGVTDYINRLYDAIRTTGWKKPIFYNISENPGFAAATVASKADGYTFQWYPSGLVGGKTLQSNYLPHVDTYRIPFGDTLPAFNNKPLMVYEFDPADIMKPIMYPAMARSFRVAGFQWATQFAYDPMAIAHANTEYQTHFLNLAYTPGKAISMLIAGEVFRNTPRMAKMEAYPADSVFGPFKTSFRESLSEMNSGEKFYYSNHTKSQPVNASTLKHVAGVGSSALVHYSGTGAYFLDQLDEGVWRLEVMPDAILLRDPVERASPLKVVSAIRWNEHTMEVQLPSLGNDFSIKGLNKGNTTNLTATSESFSIRPGTYLLKAKGWNPANPVNTSWRLPLDGFVAPENTNHDIFVNTAAPEGIPSGKPFSLQATALIPGGSKLTLLLSRPGWARPTEVPITENFPGNYSGMVPAEMALPGILQYRIRVQHGEDYTTFPGAVKGNPIGWDYIAGENREITVLPTGSDLLLFNATTDRTPIILPSWGRGIQQGLVPAQTGGGFAFQFQSNQWGRENLAALQYAVQEKLQPFENEANGYTHVVVKARALNNETKKIRLILVTKDAIAWSAGSEISTQTSEIILPLGAFNPSRYLLLPRPYPGFHPLWFTGIGNAGLFRLKDIDLIQLMVEKEDNPGLKDAGPGFEIEWIGLRK
jgi:hypothetical protein